MKIKNIILDLGGVLLNINYQLTIDAFKGLGIHDFEHLYTQANQSELFNRLETGRIDEDTFIQGVKSYLPRSITQKDIINAWNAMLLDFPEERLTFLKELNSKFNTVLLSNTNFIHLAFFHDYLSKAHQEKSLKPYFDSLYFSCEMGMRKPDAEIFQSVCKKEGYIPEVTLFIDDSIQHVEGAKSIGIQAHHLDVENTDVIQLVRSLLA